MDDKIFEKLEAVIEVDPIGYASVEDDPYTETTIYSGKELEELVKELYGEE